MQSICHLSRRWHQQFCRSPSFAPHRKCLGQWQPLRTYRVRPSAHPRATETAKPSHTGDFVVREYDQYGPDASTRVPINPELEEDRGEEADVREEMEKLQEELGEMKQGPFGPNSDFMRSLSQEQRAKLLKSLEADDGSQAEIEDVLDKMNMNLGQNFTGSEDNMLDPTAALQSMSAEDQVKLMQELEETGQDSSVDSLLDDDAFNLDDNLEESFEELDKDPVTKKQRGAEELQQAPLAVTLRVPNKHKAYVKAFNDSLLAAQNRPQQFSYHVDLWKDYLRCQQHIPNFPSFIDEDVWEFLWKSQTIHFSRPQHIVVLARDMLGAGIDFNLAQTIDYINALHATEDISSAVQIWEDARPQVGSKAKGASGFWQTGVKIYAAVGKPKKAQSIAIAAFEKKMIDADGWLPIIEAWAESQKPSAPYSLWASYLRLKEKYAEQALQEGSRSQRLPLNVLGQISSALLKTGRRDMSLAVFKDMLVSNDTQTFDSSQVYTKLIEGIQTADKTQVNESVISQIGLAALTSFPGRFKNKFFFGAWIKWLIGEGKIDDAALVIELMQEYGVRADARHLNGIIGAWLRQGSHKAKDRAEQMAWGMIHARIHQVKTRTKSFPQGTEVTNEDNPYSNQSRLPLFLQRNIPPATIETFSVLLQRYTRQQDAAKAEHLTDIMAGPAQIKPNSFILNHWMHMSLRASDLSSLWTRFNAVKTSITPDLETFAVLWSACKRNLDRASTVLAPSFPDPRRLAREMQEWFASLPEQKKQDSREAITEDLYEQIIRCFCLHSDLHGLYHMLNILRQSYHFEPHDDVLRMTLMAVARLLPADTTPHLTSKPRRAAIRRHDVTYRAALGKLGDVMQGLVDVKSAEAAKAGAGMEELDGEQVMGRVRGEAMRVFVCLVLGRMRRAHDIGNTGEGGADIRGKGKTRYVHIDLVNELVLAGKGMGVVVSREEMQAVLEDAVEYDRDAPGDGK